VLRDLPGCAGGDGNDVAGTSASSKYWLGLEGATAKCRISYQGPMKRCIFTADHHVSLFDMQIPSVY